MTDEELRTRSIAEFEVRDYAKTLRHPSIEWRDPDGRRFSIPAGPIGWRHVPLGRPDKRRAIFAALQTIEHNQQQPKEKDSHHGKQ
jgi:hypothetical protein